MICAIESDARRLKENGSVDAWLGGADESTKVISAEVNGPLLELLLQAANHEDRECANLFRYGAQLT